MFSLLLCVFLLPVSIPNALEQPIRSLYCPGEADSCASQAAECIRCAVVHRLVQRVWPSPPIRRLATPTVPAGCRASSVIRFTPKLQLGHSEQGSRRTVLRQLPGPDGLSLNEAATSGQKIHLQLQTAAQTAALVFCRFAPIPLFSLINSESTRCCPTVDQIDDSAKAARKQGRKNPSPLCYFAKSIARLSRMRLTLT